MRHGHYQTSAGANHSLNLSRFKSLDVLLGLGVSYFKMKNLSKFMMYSTLLSRQSLLSLLLNDLYIRMMRKSLQMHVGPSHIFLMVPMIKFKLLLKLVFVPDLLNCCCEYYYSVDKLISPFSCIDISPSTVCEM